MWKFQRQSLFGSNETLKCDEATAAISCECFPFFFFGLSTATQVNASLCQLRLRSGPQTNSNSLTSARRPVTQSHVLISLFFFFTNSHHAPSTVEISSEKHHLGTDKTTSLMTSLAFIPVCSTDSKQNITQE